MASGMEMMIQSAIKASGFDPKQVQADINGFRDTVMSYIATDQDWKKRESEKSDLILARLQSLLDYSQRHDFNLNTIAEQMTYGDDPLSIKPDSDASKFAHMEIEISLPPKILCDVEESGGHGCELPKGHPGRHYISPETIARNI